jgi:hypothetical protein
MIDSTWDDAHRGRGRDSAARGNGHPAASGRTNAVVAAVTQAELEAYLQLRHHRRLLDDDIEVARVGLMERLGQGAPVAPGRLRASVREVEQLRFTHDRLLEALGEEEYLRLTTQIPATLVRQLWVVSR